MSGTAEHRPSYDNEWGADRIAGVARNIRLYVDWSGARFGVNHAFSLINLHHVLSLTQE
jgi:hypothetical protein